MTATAPSWLTDFVKALMKIETDERNACAAIAEAMAARETGRAAEVAQVIAAQIRART